MNFIDLVAELTEVNDAILPIKGRIGDLSLPVYKIMPKPGEARLWLGYRPLGYGHELNSRRLLQSLKSYHATVPMIKVVLNTDTYQADYSSVSNFYEVEKIEYENDVFVLVAGDELLFARKYSPPDPYLLQMQQEEPTNPSWFPYRHGVDPVVGDIPST